MSEIFKKPGNTFCGFVIETRPFFSSHIRHAMRQASTSFFICPDFSMMSTVRGTATKAPLTHTFVYTTNPDGSLKHTYSWGNEYEDGKGVWRKDRPEDVNAANQAISNPAVRGNKVGDSTLDKHVDRLFNQWRDDINHPSRHANWIVYNNCKTEATRLINAARTQRSEGGKQN